jgi:hypothetical protein
MKRIFSKDAKIKINMAAGGCQTNRKALRRIDEIINGEKK